MPNYSGTLQDQIKQAISYRDWVVVEKLRRVERCATDEFPITTPVWILERLEQWRRWNG